MHFDTHSHAQFAAYDADRDQVMRRALDNGVWMVNVGTSLATSRTAVDLAGKYAEGVYASVGLHPGHTWHDEQDKDESPDNRREAFDPAAYDVLLNDKVVAVGEVGLDYYRLPEDRGAADKAKDLQRDAFVRQLQFARRHSLPVIIHCRDAYEDTLEVLKAEYGGPGILHSFTGDWDTAKNFLDLGFYVALNGILTFDKTGRLAEVCKQLPSDKILAETDAPYLAPAPNRGKRNEPLNVRDVAAYMADIRGEKPESFSETLFANSLAAFGIPGE